MRFILKTIGFLAVTAVIVAICALAWGHVKIRRIEPPLPTLDEVLEVDRALDLPVRLTWVNTGSQRMPRAAVLEPDLDPDPDAEYTMSHASFVVEWQDGRLFLIDTGMKPGDAVAFGEPLELLAGADRMQPHGSISEHLGEDRTRVAGIGFTHLHSDHTGGLTALCEDLATYGTPREKIPVYQGRYQIMEGNHTTLASKKQLRAEPCVRLVPLVKNEPLVPIPDFPGLFATSAAGHTPGSQVFVVQLRTFPGQSTGRYDDVETWIVTGDVVNHIDGIQRNLPKPSLYRLLVVPENDEQLGRVRGFLKELSREPDVHLLVSHDQNQLEASGLSGWD